jgi:hypothetical protein
LSQPGRRVPTWLKAQRILREATPTTEPRRRCDHADRRVIRLRWPYAEAGIVRARLVAENGHRFAVSPLFRIDGGWAFSICRECARRGAVNLEVVLVIHRWLIGAVGAPLAVALAMGAVVTAIESPVALFACAVPVLTLGIFTIGRTLTGPGSC